MRNDYPERIDSALLPEILKTKRWIILIWTDPILGNLFASGVIIIGTFIYAFIKSLICDISVKTILRNILQFDIPVYVTLIGILIFWILFIVFKRYGIPKYKRKLNKLESTKIGDFTFFDLHNTLITHQVTNPSKYKKEGSETFNILFYFVMFSRKYNVGVPGDISDEIIDFLYWTVGSILISYDLVEIRDSKEGDMMYLTENGKKFMRIYYISHYYKDKKNIDW